MKHFVFSKLLLAVLLLSCVSCVKHEELSFSGTVLGVRNCEASYMDRNAGYIVQLESPEGVGGTLTSTSGETIENVVVLYEPTRLIMVEDHIHGSFYLDNKYSRVNCSTQWGNLDLPEGVFTEVHVD